MLMKKIIGIGNALVDIMAMIDDDGMLDSFSLPKGSMQLVDRQQSESIKKEIESLITTETSGGLLPIPCTDWPCWGLMQVLSGR